MHDVVYVIVCVLFMCVLCDYFLRYSPRGSVAPDRENIESMSEERSRDKLWRHGPDPLFRRLWGMDEIQYTSNSIYCVIQHSAVALIESSIINKNVEY